mgnify:CR=1 FL=1
MVKGIDWRRIDCFRCAERFACDQVPYDCPLEAPPLKNLLDVHVLVNTEGNFTPADLMRRYAQQAPGVVFDRDPYGKALLYQGGTVWTYDRWNIGEGFVVVTLEEVQQ